MFPDRRGRRRGRFIDAGCSEQRSLQVALTPLSVCVSAGQQRQEVGLRRKRKPRPHPSPPGPPVPSSRRHHPSIPRHMMSLPVCGTLGL